MTTTGDLWLWAEGDAVRWWHPAGTALLATISPTAAPGVVSEPELLIQLRQHCTQWALDTALLPPLAACLRAGLQRHPTLRLHLHPELAQSWQQFPFEWLHCDGAPLHARLSVNRLSAPDAPPLLPLTPQRTCVVLDLLPAAEAAQSPARALSAPTAQIITGAAAVTHYLTRSDLTAVAALCLIAHGTETATAPAFRLPDGTAWTLPTERGMPPLVIVLACGDDAGNLLNEAQRLLAAGAHTVLAPLGQPTLAAASHFMREFLRRWRSGIRADTALRESVVSAAGRSGAGRLLLLGRGDLRMVDTAQWNERPDAELAAAYRTAPAALTALVTRLTQRAAARGDGLESAERELQHQLGIGAHEEAKRREMLAHLKPLEAELPLLSRAWVAPLLAHLVEHFAHDAIAELKQVRHTLDAANISYSLPLLHYWSKLYYREGEYSLALRDLALGVHQSSAAELLDAHHHYRAYSFAFIGHLCNILVDLNIPEPAQIILDQLDAALAQHCSCDTAIKRYQLLDRRARAALRSGNSERALALYRQKYHAAAQFDYNGQRELAGLIYTAAWSETPVTAEFQSWMKKAQEIVHTLAPHELSNGNDSGVYLLRAMAAWGWLRRDEKVLMCIQPFLERLRHRLQGKDNGDFGPVGLIFSFLYLAQRDGLIAQLALPAWDESAVGMERGRYFIELAALSALMGKSAESSRYLARFQQQRQLPAGVRFPHWFEHGLLADWSKLCTEQTVHEGAVFNCSELTPAQLRRSGLLPL
jgi:hypothetical protein